MLTLKKILVAVEEKRGDFTSSAPGACIARDHSYIQFVEGIFNSQKYLI